MIQHVYLDQKKRKERKKEEIGTDRHGDRQERRERRQCDQKKRENIFKNKRNKKGKMFLWLVHFSCFFSPEFLGCCRWRWATIPSLVSIFLCFVGCDSWFSSEWCVIPQCGERAPFPQMAITDSWCGFISSLFRCFCFFSPVPWPPPPPPPQLLPLPSAPPPLAPDLSTCLLGNK